MWNLNPLPHEFQPDRFDPDNYPVTPQSIARSKAECKRERERAVQQVPELRQLLDDLAQGEEQP